MFSNCLLYNGALNEYGQAGIIMNKEWQQLWAKTGLGQGTIPAPRLSFRALRLSLARFEPLLLASGF